MVYMPGSIFDDIEPELGLTSLELSALVRGTELAVRLLVDESLEQVAERGCG
jgi:hypothetical protein